MIGEDDSGQKTSNRQLATACARLGDVVRGWALRFLLGACSVAACSRPSTSEPPVRVAAASDLAPAAAALSKAFESAHGGHVEFVLGSSGLLSRQIAEGAPYDAFLAADESFADRAIDAGVCDKRTRRAYARGRLVVWTRAGAPAPAALADLADARYARIAIANPDHAPYGRAASQALERAGLWSQLEPRIVRADNVSAALALARTGNVDAALLSASLSSGDTGGRRLPVPETLHDPLVQTAVACSGGHAADAGRVFAAFVASPAGAAVLARFGFATPERLRP